MREVVGLDRVVFGSDFPYLRRDLAVSCREHIETSSELTESERTAVLGGTAAELLAWSCNWPFGGSATVGVTSPGSRDLLEGIVETLPPGARVLDSACCIGADAMALARRGFSVTASDGSASMVAEARRRCRRDLGHNSSAVRDRFHAIHAGGSHGRHSRRRTHRNWRLLSTG